MTQPNEKPTAFDLDQADNPQEILRAMLYLGFDRAEILELGSLGALSFEQVQDHEIETGLAGKPLAAAAAALLTQAMLYQFNQGLSLKDVLDAMDNPAKAAALVVYGTDQILEAVRSEVVHLQIGEPLCSRLISELLPQCRLFNPLTMQSARPWDENIAYDHAQIQALEHSAKNFLQHHGAAYEDAMELSQRIYTKLIHARLRAHAGLEDQLIAAITDAEGNTPPISHRDAERLIADCIECYVEVASRELATGTLCQTLTESFHAHHVPNASEGARRMLLVLSQSAQPKAPSMELIQAQSYQLEKEQRPVVPASYAELVRRMGQFQESLKQASEMHLSPDESAQLNAQLTLLAEQMEAAQKKLNLPIPGTSHLSRQEQRRNKPSGPDGGIRPGGL